MNLSAARVAVYALTSAGADTARNIAGELPQASLFLPKRLARPAAGEQAFLGLAKALRENFKKFQGHIVVAACGIVVRAIAPLIHDKTSDPAIVVVDQAGRHAISLLSGHLGGANDLARSVARILGGEAVITTATDTAGRPSLEMMARELGGQVENIHALSRISLAVLENNTVLVFDPDGWITSSLVDWPDLFLILEQMPSQDHSEPLVFVGPEAGPFPDSWLILRPPQLFAGLGCNRGTSLKEIEDLLFGTLSRNGLAPSALGGLASIDAKNDEPAIAALAQKLGLPLVFFSKDQLIDIQVPSPSAMVEKHMGVKSVCEAAALLAARTGRLVIPKQKSQNATLAVARTSFKS